MSEILKRCYTCKKEKPATTEYFHKKAAKKDGLHPTCRECRSQAEGFIFRPPAKSGYRRCTNCMVEKPSTMDFFVKQKGARSGFSSWCKECKRQRYQENKEEIKIQHHLYYEKNKEKVYEYIRKWREDNPEKAKEYAFNSRRRNKGKKAQALKEWRRKNIEKARAYTVHRRALKKKALGSHTAADIVAQYNRQRGKCYYCNVKVGARYDVDHVVPLSRGGSNSIENIVIACPSCNRSKCDRLPHEWARGNRLL